MNQFVLFLTISLFATLSFAKPLCPNLVGDFRSSTGTSVRITQKGCMFVEMKINQTFTDSIRLDNEYRSLSSMPQFLTAFTFSPQHLIGNAKDVKTGELQRMFTFSILPDGNLLQVRHVFKKGEILMSESLVLIRQTN